MASDLAEPETADYYADLGIPQDTSTRDVRSAFLRLAKVHHPDKQVPGEQAGAEDFRKVHEAYECLRNEASRSAYDKLYTSSLCDAWKRYRQLRAEQLVRRMEAKLQAEHDRRVRAVDLAWEDEQNARREQYEERRKELESRKGRDHQLSEETRAAKGRTSAQFKTLRAAEEQLVPFSSDRLLDAYKRCKIDDSDHQPSSRDSQTCVHPQRRWPARRRSGGSCVFCGGHCDGWTLQCPECHSPACHVCKAYYSVFLYDRQFRG